MDDVDTSAAEAQPGRRADARRNQATVLEAAALAFVESGVDAPVRLIASRAGVGVGTIYRHFPTRADLVVAVYRHQIEACAEAGPRLLEAEDSPYAALRQWVDLFVDFLVTKHGLAAALRDDASGITTLHRLFVERLLPVLSDLLAEAVAAGEVTADLSPYELMRGIGNLCAGSEADEDYDADRLVALLLAGCRA
jgi:AcrR family transcriptional regulator